MTTLDDLAPRAAAVMNEPPLWMQNAVYPAGVDRVLIEALFPAAAVQGDNELKVAPRALGANMSVDVGPGRAVIAGTDAPGQGNYLCRSHDIENLAIGAAPGAGLARIDTVVARVYDDALIGGAVHAWALEVIEGVAAAAPAAPGLPPSCLPLANVAVASGLAAVVAAQITDRRAVRPGLGRFARVVCDGTTAMFNVDVPPSALSIHIKWRADSAEATVRQHNMNLYLNGDQTAQYSDSLQWFGTVMQLWNRPTASEWFVGALRGNNTPVSGIIDILFANRDTPGSQLTTALWQCEINEGGMTGRPDPTILRYQGVGHYWDNGGGVTRSLRLLVSPGNFRAGSTFDFYAT